MSNKKLKKTCKKLIEKYQYLYQDTEITTFPSINNESAFYDLYVRSIDKKITIANFYADSTNSNKFQENWYITDELGNQIVFGGFSEILKEAESTGKSMYAISSSLGELWSKVNLIEIIFNNNGTRDLLFYQIY